MLVADSHPHHTLWTLPDCVRLLKKMSWNAVICIFLKGMLLLLQLLRIREWNSWFFDALYMQKLGGGGLESQPAAMRGMHFI